MQHKRLCNNVKGCRVKWYIVTIMNNTKYYYKGKGSFDSAMIWTSSKHNALTWSSKGAVEYYMARNQIVNRGIIQHLKED